MSRALLVFAISCHLLLSVGYLVWTPAFEGPDEPGHFAYAQHIANTKSLPIVRGTASELGRSPFDEADMAHHPPLYYGLVAATLTATGRSDTLHTPRGLTVVAAGDASAKSPSVFVHGGDERGPVSRGVTTLWILRAWSVLLGAVSVLLVYRLGRTCLPDDPLVAGWAALLVACLPMWSFLHGVVNSDTLATTLSFAALCGIVEWTRSERWTTTRAIALGALLGLGLSTKLTCVFLFALVAVTWLVRFWKRADQRADHLRHGAWIAATAFAICGWWIGRNAWLYADPLGLGSHGATFESTRVPDEMRWTWIRDGFLPQVFTSLLGTFGWFRLWPARWLVWLGACSCIVASIGVGIAWRRRECPRAPALLLGAIALVFALTLQFNLEFRQPQGRLLFPALAAVSIWFALGLVTVGRTLAGRLLPARSRSRTVAAIAVALGPPAVAAWVLLGWFRPAFALSEAPPSRYTAALTGSVLPRDDDHAWTWSEPSDGFESTDAPAAWRVEVGNSPPTDGPVSLYVWDESGRVWLATWEWAATDIDPHRAFRIPDLGWELLPSDRTLFARLRRVPDRIAGERLDSMPTSDVLQFRKLGAESR